VGFGDKGVGFRVSSFGPRIEPGLLLRKHFGFRAWGVGMGVELGG